jgi:putative sugar O-methyltransferase
MGGVVAACTALLDGPTSCSTFDYAGAIQPSARAQSPARKRFWKMKQAITAELQDNGALLASMLQDAAAQSELYRPGAYWNRKTKNTADQISRHGIGDFRGATSTIGLSFTDSVYVDVRHDLNGGVRSVLRTFLTSAFPINRIFNSQVALTRAHEAEARRLRSIMLRESHRVRELVERYCFPPSLLGGCLEYVELGERRIATHYLNVLHQHDRVASKCRFSDVSSILEIGGGFGANIHCLIENYPKLRKVVYLDIPPNLYIGTQYLRAIYGAAVIDYGQTRGLSQIEFSDNDNLEILAIAPWQIERLAVSIDLFYNAHSFVEMPADVISNYARHVAALRGFDRTRVVMLTYNNFDPRTTLDPERLPGCFPGKVFERMEFPLLDSRFGVFAFVSCS